MIGSPTEACRFCAYFYLKERECRRFPPTMTGFPIIDKMWLCGEYVEADVIEVD